MSTEPPAPDPDPDEPRGAAGGDSTPAPAAGAAPDEATTGDPGRLRWFQPPSLLQAVAMAVALLFLGGVVGWAVSSGSLDDTPNEADVGFLQDMITHHEQALDMAHLVMGNTDDITTQRFAEEVAFFQAREIGIMQHLLEGWGYDLSERPDDAMAWMDMTVPVEEMPGLATDEEMQALADATGSDVDRLFLELMIDHHLGGVHMAEAGAGIASHDDVRQLAEVMATNQRVEVDEYRLLQERLGFEVS